LTAARVTLRSIRRVCKTRNKYVSIASRCWLMTSPKYMFWLIERTLGYMTFNMNAKMRQERDTRTARSGAGLREFWRLD
jgi:hypothetical protein